MIPQWIMDYAAPAVATAALGVVGTVTIGHSERLAVLETEGENSIEIQRELVQKVDNLTRLVVKIDTKIEERDKYEQRAR